MKIINFRPIFYCFLAFAIGIASCFYIFNANIAIIALLTLIFGVIVFFTIKTKTYKNFLAIIIAFVLGFGFFAVDYKNFAGNKFNGKTVEISGRVSDDVYFGENYSSIILENVKIDGVFDKNINVSINGNCDFETGDYFYFVTKLYNEQIFENGAFNSSAYKNNYSYFCQIEASEIEIKEGGKTFIENFKISINELLNSFMSETNASLAYSVLFGDRSNLDDGVRQNFSVSGIAHLLAVSGLHIGFICAILLFALQKLRPFYKFIIIAIFLGIYATLCNFSPSVVRASIMCLAFLGFGLLGKQYDFLNSIGIAGIIILLIWPCSVFDPSFQMSFLSVLAIGMMLKPLSKLFQKIKIPKKLAEAMAIDLSTTLAILPIMAIYYGNLSALCWFANLICIPLFAMAYMFLFVLTFVCFIFKFLGFLLIIPQILFSLIILVADFIANMSWAIIPLIACNIVLIATYYVFYFICGKFVMLDFRKKLVSLNCVLCIGLALSGLLYIEKPINENTITKLNTSSMCVVIETNGETVVVAESGDLEYLQKYLVYQKIYHINTFILTDKECVQSELFVEKYKIKNYFNKQFEDFYCDNYDIKFIVFNNILKAVYIENENISAMIAVNKIGSNQLSTIASDYSDKSIEVLCEDSIGYNFTYANSFNYVFSKKEIEVQNNFATFLLGTFTFSFDNDKILEKR